jgi:hypothetical protein
MESLRQFQEEEANNSKFDISIDEKEHKLKKRFEKVNEINKKYFQHLAGDCRCGRCKCERCKCVHRELQPDYKRYNTTIYRAEHNEKPIEILDPFPLDIDTYRADTNIEMKTTNRS